MSAPAKRTLSQDAIIDAGLTLVSDAGIDGLSFRKLADKLDVTPMALYRHFDDKQALLTALLDALITRADVLPKKELAWDDWIIYVSEGMYHVLVEEPSWLAVLGHIPLRQAGFQVFEASLRVLGQAGFDRPQAVSIFIAMLQCIFGAALTNSQLKHTAALMDIDLDQYPAISEALPVIGSVVDKGSHLYISLLPMIEGLRQQLAD